MAQHVTQGEDYFDSSNGSPIGREKEKLPSDNGTWSGAPAYPDAAHNDQKREVFDPYGGKKLGMFRVSLSSLT